jgi:transcriptional regulator with XRE-family HTH domain
VTTEDPKTREPTLVARNVKRLRDARGWTQGELCSATGGAITQGQLSRFERGEVGDIGSGRLAAIARALGVSVTELHAPDGTEPNPSLERFLRSDLASDITDEERAALARTSWDSTDAPPAAWYHLLQALRLVREKRKSSSEG